MVFAARASRTRRRARRARRARERTRNADARAIDALGRPFGAARARDAAPFRRRSRGVRAKMRTRARANARRAVVARRRGGDARRRRARRRRAAR